MIIDRGFGKTKLRHMIFELDVLAEKINNG
jgi:hypothetical protein